MNLPVPERYKRLFDAFDDIARRHGGKPHLAKQRRPPVDEAELQRMYPRIDKWRVIVKKVDPEGLFWSPFFEAQFGRKQGHGDAKELNKRLMGKESLLRSATTDIRPKEL